MGEGDPGRCEGARGLPCRTRQAAHGVELARGRKVMKLANACLVAALAAIPLSAQAEELTYKFSFGSPPTSWINTGGITPWTEEVAKLSGGDLKIQVFAGAVLANARNVYDRVINGVVELGYNAFADTDQFPGLD